MGRILRNQYTPGFCFFFKPSSLDKLLTYLAKDLKTDPLTTENQVFEMTLVSAMGGLANPDSEFPLAGTTSQRPHDTLRSYTSSCKPRGATEPSKWWRERVFLQMVE